MAREEKYSRKFVRDLVQYLEEQKELLLKWERSSVRELSVKHSATLIFDSRRKLYKLTVEGSQPERK